MTDGGENSPNKRDVSNPGAQTAEHPTGSPLTTHPKHGNATRKDYQSDFKTLTSYATPAITTEEAHDLGG